MIVANECAGHACRCRGPVPSSEAIGVVLRSSSPVVRSKLAKAFQPAEAGEGVFKIVGPDWCDQLTAFYAAISPMEQPTVRAATINAAGYADPWQAIPLGRLLERMRTRWFPSLLNENRLRAYLQPILNLKTERVAAFESLVRAEECDRVRSGGEIIEAARAHDALFQFDQKAREIALRQGALQLAPGEKLFINFCPTVIYDPDICLRNTWKIADELGIDLSQVVFEVVESERFPRLEHLRKILDAYRDRGAQVALDDLGAGHTAIKYIDELRPDIVKLDRELLPHEEHAADIGLLDGFVGYARSRGVKVVIEGIETATQYRIAKHVGVDYGQGYFIGRPAPVASRKIFNELAVAS
ncbi:MAG: EAL domain-containing protein [Phycisphaeraceae bacterium]